MTTSAIERVARAIALTAAASGSKGDDLLRDLAFAAFQEIRIPDDHAIAAVEAWSRTSKTARTWAEGFTVMVDAMLGERPDV